MAKWRFVEVEEDSDRWVLEDGEGNVGILTLFSSQSEREFLLRILNAHEPIREALDDVEWALPANLSDLLNGEVCPWCTHHRDDGHHVDCELGNALRLARGES